MKPLIKIIQPAYELKRGWPKHAFVLDTPIKLIRPVPNHYQDSYTANLEVFDDEGYLFLIEQKPSVTPTHLYIRIAEMRSDLKKEIIQKTGVDFKDVVVCVDPRILMVHILEWWRCPYNDEAKMEILQTAYNPPPTYEEAEKWLVDNRFIGPKALREGGYPGRWVYAFETPRTFKNLPEKYLHAIDKICELIKNDETLSKEDKEYEINQWRIPKE